MKSFKGKYFVIAILSSTLQGKLERQCIEVNILKQQLSWMNQKYIPVQISFVIQCSLEIFPSILPLLCEHHVSLLFGIFALLARIVCIFLGCQKGSLFLRLPQTMSASQQQSTEKMYKEPRSWEEWAKEGGIKHPRLS